MKHVISIFVSLAAVSCIIARPQEEAQLLQFINDNNLDGTYVYVYPVGPAEESKQVEDDELPSLTYEFSDPTGQRYQIDYVPDEKGFSQDEVNNSNRAA